METVKIQNGRVICLDDKAFVRLLKTDVADVLLRKMRRDKARGRGRQKSVGLDAPTEKWPLAPKNVNDDKPEGAQ